MIHQKDLDELAKRIEAEYLTVLDSNPHRTDEKTQELIRVALEQLAAIETVERWASKCDMLVSRKTSKAPHRMRSIKDYGKV